jgi:glycosyltransferase involved in cell wall biosynthesis
VTVVTFHNLAYSKGANRAGLGLRLKRQLAALLYPRGFSQFLAVSQAVAMHYRDALGLQSIAVVHNPVDLQTIDRLCARIQPASNDHFHLVVAGRLVAEKGHSVFLQALALLLQRNPKIQATLIGDGPLRPGLEREIKRLGLGGAVQLTGTLSHDAMLQIVATAHAVVVPSHFEGFGLVAAEAMAASRAVVVTNVGGLAELVEQGISGIVVPPAEPQALATAIATLLDSPAQCAALGAGARRRIEQSFALPTVVDELQRVYARLLASDGSR